MDSPGPTAPPPEWKKPFVECKEAWANYWYYALQTGEQRITTPVGGIDFRPKAHKLPKIIYGAIWLLGATSTLVLLYWHRTGIPPWQLGF